jgi:hypothetical protein
MLRYFHPPLILTNHLPGKIHINVILHHLDLLSRNFPVVYPSKFINAFLVSEIIAAFPL